MALSASTPSVTMNVNLRLKVFSGNISFFLLSDLRMRNFQLSTKKTNGPNETCWHTALWFILEAAVSDHMHEGFVGF